MKEIIDMVRKAEDCLESAEYNLAGDFLDAAVNRSYYGVYDCLSALLLSKGLYAKTHSGAQTLFAEHFIKAGIFPKQMSVWINYCFEMRQQSDYDFSSKLEPEEAISCVVYSRSFILSSKEYLEKECKIEFN